MANLYIFTAGTSLLDNLEKLPGEGLRLRETLDARLKNVGVDELLSGQLLAGAEWRGSPGGGLNEVGALWALHRWAGFTPDGFPQTAELTSLYKLSLQPGMALSDKDEVVLLASDTPTGVFCAAVNAYLMTALCGPVWRWDLPFQVGEKTQFAWEEELPQTNLQPHLLSVARPRAYLLRVKNLNPADKNAFEEGVSRVEGQQGSGAAHLIRTVVDLVWGARDGGLKPVIVFTGGFKAGIPLLTQASAWLGGVPLWGLYEGSKVAPVQVPVLEARPQLEDCRLVVSFGAVRANHSYPELRTFDRSVFRNVADLPIDREHLFFRNRSDGGGIELSLLGIALCEWVDAEIIHQRMSLGDLRNG